MRPKTSSSYFFSTKNNENWMDHISHGRNKEIQEHETSAIALFFIKCLP